MPDTTSATVSGDTPSAENKDPQKVTKAEHEDAVKAVTGQFAPAPPEDQEGVVTRTRDLPSETAKTATLVEETQAALTGGSDINPFTASLASEERAQKFVRTLANGKTEAILEGQPAAPTFPPDDGGYNPEKRTHAGPAGAMTPQAAEAHVLSGTDRDSDLPPGWREEHRVS